MEELETPVEGTPTEPTPTETPEAPAAEPVAV